MIATPDTKKFDWLASDLERSPGVHASDIFGDLFEFLDKRYQYEGPPNPLSLALGTAWEKHFEYLLAKNGIEATRPGELISPDEYEIPFSPDLIIFNGVVRVGEIKLSSMSAKDLPEEETDTLPPKLDKYLCQMKLYAHWLDLYDGWLGMILLYQPWNPQFRAYNIHWTKQELVENYQMCIRHAKERNML